MYELNKSEQENLELIENVKKQMYETTFVPKDFMNERLLKDSFRPRFDTGNPCENCPNNPKNNPHLGGFCNCALPSLMNPIY
jgi:hypothetical protein